MGYPNTQNNSIFDLSKFGLPTNALNSSQTLPNQQGLSPSYFNPFFSANASNGSTNGKGFMNIPSWQGNATPTSDFNFGSIDGSRFGFDENNGMALTQTEFPEYNFGQNYDVAGNITGDMSNWGSDRIDTGGASFTPEFDPMGNQQDSGFGWNMDTANFGLKGLATLGNLWGAFQGNKLARKQFSLASDAYNTNLTNQIKSYNTTLEERIKGRHPTNDVAAQAKADAYIAANKLTR